MKKCKTPKLNNIPELGDSIVDLCKIGEQSLKSFNPALKNGYFPRSRVAIVAIKCRKEIKAHVLQARAPFNRITIR